MKKKWYLVVKGDGTKPRVLDTKNRVRLKPDEVALTITLDYPAGWQQVYTEGPTIKIPPPPTDLRVTK